jgi:hypothetical protein
MLYDIELSVELSEDQVTNIAVRYLQECFHCGNAPKKEMLTVLEFLQIESEFEEWKSEVIEYFGSLIYEKD